MSDVLEPIKQQLTSVPQELVKPIIVGTVAIIVLLILLLFILGVLYINSSKPPVVPIIKKKQDSPPPKKEEAKKVKIKYEDLPIISGRIGELLALNGIINVGPITKIFLQVLEVIKNTTYDIRWRYKLPCLMLVGAENSGKTTLLNSLKFENLSSDNTATPMWKLFKKGAIFEVPKPDITEKESIFWSFLSDLFMFIRPRRPLDGIIITIPADILLSKAVDIETYAKDLFSKIFTFQRDINFRLPIYVIVTKSDLIEGFTDFAHLLNNQSKQQIFGWSNPNSLNTAFSSACIQDIFETVNIGIRKTILIFSKKKDVTENLRKAVLFETYFNQIRESLSIYLNAMFQSHNPSDGLLLRGVYFTGKHKEVELSEELLEPSALSPKPYSHIDLKNESSYNDELYFLQDLFAEKIFKEHNIAYPIRNDAVDITKHIFYRKLIFAGVATVVSFGWFYGNYHIRERINGYYKTFASIKTMMLKLQQMEHKLSSYDDQILLNEKTKNLLQSMPIITRLDFISFFVPQSWISHLYKSMIDTTSLVFDSVVIKAMFIDLNMNTKSALGQLENPQNDIKQYEHQDLFDVSSFASFKKLKDFTDRISTLKKLTREYNSIRHLEDRKNLIDLTKELFKDKFDIVEEMKNRSPNKKILPPQFELQIFKDEMEERLIQIFNDFVNEVFNGNIDKIFHNICEDIDRMELASRQSGITYTTADLARVYQKTILLSDVMKNKNFAWKSGEHFMPFKDYSKMIDTLNASEIVSMDCVRDLLRSAEIEFQKFKDKLRAHKTAMTGNVISENLENVSQSFETFQKELKTILDFSFICTAPNASLTTVIMDDKMLIWDVKRLKELSDLIEQYYVFSATMPQDMRAQYFEKYKVISRKCFYPVAQAILGNAQIFDDLPLGNAHTLLEDAYKKQCNNIRKSSVFLGKTAKFFNEVCSEDSAKDCGFTSMLISHYTSLLEKIDALFNLETPYSIGNSAFDSWNGEMNPKFLNIREDQALKQYLLAQFNRLKFLAKDLASPVVELLSMPVFAENIRDKTLINKWSEIISSIADYEAQKPGNSIAALESFLSETLKKVSINSFDSEGEIKTISESRGDFFASKRSDVAKALINRADVIQYDKAAASYKAIQSFFNRNLAHKFPFGNSESDADLNDIEKFIKIYDQQSTNLQEVLKGNAERKQINPQVFDFLESLSRIIPFLRNWILHTKSSDAQSAIFSFTVALRPSPESEISTSSVVERHLKVKGADIEDGGSAVFFNEDSVEVQFSWIEDADEKPYNRNLSKNLEIDGLDAIFSFKGKWGMFKLIEEHKLNKQTEYPNGVLLQFEVPIIDQNNNVLTSRMIFKVTPVVKEGDKASNAVWPVFPVVAPELHSNEVSANNAFQVNSSNSQINSNATTLTGIEAELQNAVEPIGTAGL